MQVVSSWLSVEKLRLPGQKTHELLRVHIVWKPGGIGDGESIETS